MITHRIELDRSSKPTRISFPPVFNICGLFVDFHLDNGRADKIVARGRTWSLSFRELHRSVCKMGNALKSMGVSPGDRVMLFAKDTPAFFIGFLGAARIGAVVIPTNTFLRTTDYAYMLADFKAKVVIVADGTIEEVEPALSKRRRGGDALHRHRRRARRAGLTSTMLLAQAGIGLPDRRDERQLALLLALLLGLDRIAEGFGARAQGHGLHVRILRS